MWKQVARDTYVRIYIQSKVAFLAVATKVRFLSPINLWTIRASVVRTRDKRNLCLEVQALSTQTKKCFQFAHSPFRDYRTLFWAGRTTLPREMKAHKIAHVMRRSVITSTKHNSGTNNDLTWVWISSTCVLSEVERSKTTFPLRKLEFYTSDCSDG